MFRNQLLCFKYCLISNSSKCTNDIKNEKLIIVTFKIICGKNNEDQVNVIKFLTFQLVLI